MGSDSYKSDNGRSISQYYGNFITQERFLLKFYAYLCSSWFRIFVFLILGCFVYSNSSLYVQSSLKYLYMLVKYTPNAIFAQSGNFCNVVLCFFFDDVDYCRAIGIYFNLSTNFCELYSSVIFIISHIRWKTSTLSSSCSILRKQSIKSINVCNLAYGE